MRGAERRRRESRDKLRGENKSIEHKRDGLKKEKKERYRIEVSRARRAGDSRVLWKREDKSGGKRDTRPPDEGKYTSGVS